MKTWDLDIYRYENQKELINSIEPKVISPAEKNQMRL